jgi:hypothetical protein
MASRRPSPKSWSSKIKEDHLNEVWIEPTKEQQAVLLMR